MKKPEEIGMEWLDKHNEPAIISIVDRPKEDEFCVPRSMIEKAIKLALKAEREETNKKVELLKRALRQITLPKDIKYREELIDKIFKGEK